MNYSHCGGGGGRLLAISNNSQTHNNQDSCFSLYYKLYIYKKKLILFGTELVQKSTSLLEGGRSSRTLSGRHPQRSWSPPLDRRRGSPAFGLDPASTETSRDAGGFRKEFAHVIKAPGNALHILQ